MKLRDMMFLVIGGLLVISGMVLNALLSGNAEAQEGVKDATFRTITCEGILVKNLFIGDRSIGMKGSFGIGDGSTDNAHLLIYGDDDGDTAVAYLGVNPDYNNEVMFTLKSKSKTDKREARMSIDEHGGKFDIYNKMGESVARIGVISDGGGAMGIYDKFGYTR